MSFLRFNLKQFVRILAIVISLILFGGLVGNIVIMGPVHSAVNFACPGAIYEFEVTGLDPPWVALTIDDGPDPSEHNTTAKILDVLQQNRATATFFVISENLGETPVTQRDPRIQRLLAEGHELGNHLTRDEASILLGNRFVTELQIADERLKPYLEGKPPRWVRPGVGFCSTVMQTDITQTGDHQPAVLGSVWPFDTVSFLSQRFIADFILDHVRPGSIIVLHDGGERGDTTASVLAAILPKLTQDYKVVSLSEMLAAKAVPVFSERTHVAVIQSVQDGLRYSIALGLALIKTSLFRRIAEVGLGVLGLVCWARTRH